MMPLGMASPGDVNTIQKITGKDDVRQHLAELWLEKKFASSANWAEI